MNWTRWLVMIIMLLATWNVMSGGDVRRAELQNYEILAEQFLHQSHNPNVNVNLLLAIEEKLMHMGANACREYALVIPAQGPFCTWVTAQVDQMKSLTFTDMQYQWHQKNLPRSKGFGKNDVAEKTVSGSLMDMMVHPATAYILLGRYQQTHNPTFLQMAKVETEKALQHVHTVQGR